MSEDAAPIQPLSTERKAELLHRLRRAEGQVRGLQKLLEDGADCSKIAQQLLATRHALDSTYVRLNLSVAEQELAAGAVAVKPLRGERDAAAHATCALDDLDGLARRLRD